MDEERDPASTGSALRGPSELAPSSGTNDHTGAGQQRVDKTRLGRDGPSLPSIDRVTAAAIRESNRNRLQPPDHRGGGWTVP